MCRARGQEAPTGVVGHAWSSVMVLDVERLLLAGCEGN